MHLKFVLYVCPFRTTKEHIFVIGGGTAQQIGSTHVDEFLVREGRWRERALLVSRCQQLAATVLKLEAAADQEGGEKALISIFGGSFIDGPMRRRLRSCELYDVSQDRKHKLRDLREKRNVLGFASLPGDNRVFLFGGNNGSSVHACVVFCEQTGRPG
ncbi:unnamed protein product [Schistocephalus solidus]|uniref:Kelch repeat-containing protein n=1 Tax=Schistocephalus solidus TaxID=70667 RepID=A0A183T381_SCHSO|nr:unnamed protein product [Schistocephalus solidus]